MSDQELPPFGIRGLQSPSKPFSILSLSEGQYNASVLSYPDSALTWLDDDDGEVITVGSGSELRQRLEDPTPVFAPKVKYFNKDTQNVEDRYVHLFDIARSTETALSVWREQEAYFSKTQVPSRPGSPIMESKPAVNKEDKSQTTPDSASDTADASKIEALRSTTQETAVSVETRDVDLKQAVPELIDCLGRQLGHLADFLQTTSETLKRAAEKTRDADTSPIEDILSGMTNILGEVGAFGLDVFDKLNEPAVYKVESVSEKDTCETIVDGSDKPVDDTPTSSEPPMSAPWADWPPYTPHSEVIRVSAEPVMEEVKFVPNETKQHRAQHQSGEAIPPTHKVKPAVITLDAGQQSWPHALQKETAGIKISAIKNMEQPSTGAFDGRTSPSSHSISNSILDQDADAIDADFSARFPPLMSLRRAKTTGALRDHTLDKDLSQQGNRQSSIRPSPHVFDAETQRRRMFAQSCYPGQEYTPDSSQTTKGISTVPNLAAAVKALKASKMYHKVSPTTTGPHMPLPAFSPSTFKSDYTQTATKAGGNADLKSKPFVHDVVYQRLPGAWPEAKNDIKSPSSNAPSHESSGAFFNRMMKNTTAAHDRAGSKAKVDAVQHSLRRYGSVASAMNKPRASGDLRRTQTVTSNTNPAARLNGPFDPVYPTPLFVNPTEEEQPLLSKPTAGPIRSIHRSLSDRRPRSFYEPYKHTSGPRDFEPVWEDHLQPKHADSHTGVVIIDASNFEPGTTEQSVRDLLSDDCNPGNGPSTLISCRIVSTQPVVVAKLVINNKAAGDKIIQKYNKMMIRERQLHFEYSKSGIDAQINHIRGAISRTEAAERRELRPMQSVPAFFSNQPGRSQSLRDPRPSKPTFAEFANRLRPVVMPGSNGVPARTSFQPSVNQSSKKATAGPSSNATAAITPPRVTVQAKPTSELKSTPIDRCTSALEWMGFGKNDASLQSRLRVYAVAANGVVEDAVDMIEQDQKATLESQAIKEDEDDTKEPAWLAQVEADEAETSERLEAEELEWAIKMSMMDK